MAKRKETLRLIAEVDLKCKNVRFFYGANHFASCYPNKSKSTMKVNVYRYMQGALKTFNNNHYFFMDFEGIPFTPETFKKLEGEALNIARAQLKEKELKSVK